MNFAASARRGGVRILITGASGLAGSHAARELARAGHELRVLARDEARVARALAPLGVRSYEFAKGDVADRAAVAPAVEGCDAVVHAAAVFTLDVRRARELERTNIEGTRIVLELAVERRLDPVIHLSSLSALLPTSEPLLRDGAALQSPRDMYAASKAAAEEIARAWQARGAPVVIFHPGSLWGPFDPTLGDGVRTVVGFIRRGLWPFTPGGLPFLDVRDLAAAIRAACAPARGARSYLAGGHLLAIRELAEICRGLTGRRMLGAPVPGAAMRALGRVGDLLRRAGIPTGMTYEAMCTLTRAVPSDNARLAAELGVVPRPPAETLRDALRWMYEVGELGASEVGQLAELPASIYTR
jgi:nucleoside-diphosphate-sugar epimerase